MTRRPVVILIFFLLFSMIGPPARAGWTRPTKKKPTTAWQGFKDSANGAVKSVLPWNWFEQPKPKYRSAAYSEYRDR